MADFFMRVCCYECTNTMEGIRSFYSCIRGNLVLCIKNHFQKIWPVRTPTMALMYYFCSMKKSLFIFSFMILFMLVYIGADAQCAMCTKTAQQLGEKPAQGMNSGILYLMLMPFAIVGFIGYRWWKNQSTN